MSNANNTRKSFGWPHLVGVVFLVLLVVGIAFLRQKTQSPASSTDSTSIDTSIAPIATPDTTTADIDSIVEPVPIELAPDTYQLGAVDDPEVSPDRRPADKAGYEDGYLAGSEDALTHQYHASYDETNSFVGTDNDTYNRHYREGYEAAYKSASKDNASQE